MSGTAELEARAVTPTGVLTALLDAAAEQHPDRPAVGDPGGIDTYAQLERRSWAAAYWLRRHGVHPGDRVVLRLSGGRDFAAMLYGVLRLGAVAVPVHERADLGALGWVVRDAQPVLVVTGTATSVAGALDVPVLAAPRLPARAPRTAGPDVAAPAGTALLIYTSGTTAQPRAVVCPHERVLFAVRAVNSRLGYTAADSILCPVPVSFDYGLYQIFLAAVAGAHVTFTPGGWGPTVLWTARLTAATVLPLVPSMVPVVARSAELGRAAPMLRMVTCTGAALPPSSVDRLRRAMPKVRVLPMYGMTECKRITIGDHADADAGSVGRPLTGTRVSIVDEHGAGLGPGLTGEVRVAGPHVMRGYHGYAPDSSPRFVRPDAPDRALLTGDYGYLDRSGRLFLRGRRDDIFQRHGIRTSCQEIEAALLRLPGVAQAAVVPPRSGGPLVAWVVGETTPAQVLRNAVPVMRPGLVPDRCVLVPELPHTVHGKVDRPALREAQWTAT